MWLNTKKYNCLIIQFVLQKLPNCLLRWLQHFSFPPTMNENSCFSISLPTFDVLTILNFIHFNRWVVITHCYLDLKFPNDIWWTTFHVLICHLHISLVWSQFMSFTPFLIGLFTFLLLGFKRFLYVLVSSTLSTHVFCKYFLLVCDLYSHFLMDQPDFKYSVVLGSNSTQQYQQLLDSTTLDRFP